MLRVLLYAVLLFSFVANSALAAPAGISARSYLNYSCDGLFREAQQVSARALSISHRRSYYAPTNNPVVSTSQTVIVPQVLDGSSPASGELADIKQRMQALEDASIQQQCAIEFISPVDR